MATSRLESPPKPRRRWLQFSLRTFLLVVLASGVGLGWLGTKLKRVHEQRQIATQIAAAGGKVYYDYQFTGRHIKEDQPPPGPRLLCWAFGDDLFAYIQTVTFGEWSGCKDQVLESLPKLPRLTELSVYGPGITDQGIAHIQRIPALRDLSLYNTNVTPDGLSQLSCSPTIHTLALLGASVTDAHLERLAELPAIERLQLHGTSITDEGMCHLGKLERLRSFELYVARRSRMLDSNLSATCTTWSRSVSSEHLSPTTR